MTFSCVNAYYFRHLNRIGGIESHLYYIAKKYKDYDITVFYRSADMEQLARLKKYIRCIQLNDKDFVKCEVLFCCFNREILDQCQSGKTYLVLHGDYKDMVERNQLSMNNLPLDKRIDEYIGVSQLVCDSWEELSGIKAENVYEPIILNNVDKPLMLVSATRLTKEKGWERMVKLATEMNSHNVNYLWFVFTDTQKEPLPNMVFVKPRLDIADKLGGFDAFVQLSDNEGFCLSIVEALKRGLPIICTDLPVLREIGLNETNSVKLPLDMSNIPLDEIKNIRKLKFKYKEPKDRWDTVLNKHKNEKLITVKAVDYKKYGVTDTELNRIPERNEEWVIDWYRYEEIRAYEMQRHIRLIEVVDGIH